MLKKVIIAAVLVVVITTSFMYGYIEWYGRNLEPSNADVIIVLGAAVWQNGPSPALLERISLAEDLYRRGYAPAIITTGGTGTLNPTPEGTAARLALVTRGIPPDAIHEEIRSRNTRENLAEAGKIMLRYGWKKAIIVTHDYHLLRAITEARRLGIEASGAGVHRTAMFRPPLVLREVLANLVRVIV
ncbi:YdcF family protein [Moorella sulfitireducens]|uniref:YdcF family protein n=1 Tax=Neomoorella sulfitireducens TaxID=2972948 RepID=UPI0021AD3590|nr:YdcF family protein [Moorella sulfitireducens]